MVTTVQVLYHHLEARLTPKRLAAHGPVVVLDSVPHCDLDARVLAHHQHTSVTTRQVTGPYLVHASGHTPAAPARVACETEKDFSLTPAAYVCQGLPGPVATARVLRGTWSVLPRGRCLEFTCSCRPFSSASAYKQLEQKKNETQHSDGQRTHQRRSCHAGKKTGTEVVATPEEAMSPHPRLRSLAHWHG